MPVIAAPTEIGWIWTLLFEEECLASAISLDMLLFQFLAIHISIGQHKYSNCALLVSKGLSKRPLFILTNELL